MAGWQRRVHGNQIEAILIQETHVTSDHEAQELTGLWTRMWGRTPNPDHPLAYWSVTDTAAAGVAILLHPSAADKWSPIDVEMGTGRVLAIATTDRLLVNIYAPNVKRDREVFFADLHQHLPTTPARTLIMGDFNCVLDPKHDRRTNNRAASGPTESAMLSQLVAARGWTDLQQPRNNRTPTTEAPDEHTYSQGPHSARLDRAYATADQLLWHTGTDLLTPHAPTDHLGIATWWRNPALQAITRPQPPLVYPIRGRDQDQLNADIERAITETARTAKHLRWDWDRTLATLTSKLRDIRRTEARRARQALKKWERRQRARVITLRDMINYERQRIQRRVDRRRGTRLQPTPHHGALFARLWQRERRPIEALRPQSGAPKTHSNLANVMAAAWGELLSTQHTTVPTAELPRAVKGLYTIPDDRKLDANDNELLMQPITPDEVERAMKQIGAHKAAGPDRLNNDFFRDWGHLLIDQLTDAFNKIMEGDEMPKSFAEAVVVPLPKAGDPTDPMNYRPIALLQSSYKILAKIVADRVQASLGKIIDEDQNGFVRGRSMANNTRLMQAILGLEYLDSDEDINAAITVILLDFKKAYDTLGRDFLKQALRDFGYSERFIDLIQRMHANTTARFIVNGELSHVLLVCTGIRQGCPLAPLLFLIAVETLRYAIKATKGLEGIIVPGTTSGERHSFSAFVDDSVAFLRRLDMAAKLTETLARFAALSGLQVQPKKSHAIILNTAHRPDDAYGYPVVPYGQVATYLGLDIGVGLDLAQHNWTKRLAKLKKRLGIASQFTTSMLDRVQVLNSVALPSILFVAQSHTPTKAILTELDAVWRQYLWKGTVDSQPLRNHKIAKEILALPPALMGLGLRDYREAMVAQATRHVLWWNSQHPSKYWEIQAQQLRHALGTTGADPPRSHPSASAIASSIRVDGTQPLSKLGWRTVNAMLADKYHRPASISNQIQDLLHAIMGPERGLQWLNSNTGRLQIPAAARPRWQQLCTAVYATMPTEIRSFWLSFPWYDNTWIISANGASLTRTGYSTIAIHRLQELQLRQNDDGTYSFKNPTTIATSRMRPHHRANLAQWLCCIILCTGIPPHDQDAVDGQRVYSSNSHQAFDKYEWRCNGQGFLQGQLLEEKWGLTDHETPPLRARYSRWGQPVEFGTSDGQWTTICPGSDGPVSHVILAGHPAVHHGPVMLQPKNRYLAPLPRQHLRYAIRTTDFHRRRRIAHLEQVKARVSRQLQLDPAVHTPILRADLPLVTKNAAWTDGQRSFQYRLLLGALNTRDNVGNKMRCPHDACADDTAPLTLAHCVWHCPVARRSWTHVWTTWTQVTPPADAAAWASACLGPTTPTLARWIRTALHERDFDHQTIQDATDTAWNVIGMVTRHTLWLRRNEASFRPDPPATTQGLPAQSWEAALRQVNAIAVATRATTDRAQIGACLQAIGEALRADVLTPMRNERQVRLYYDGGARGNPGLSGTGSVIIEKKTRSSQWEVVWWDAHRFPDSQTNNYAEHMSIARGLAACARRYGDTTQEIDIRGDSQLVTSQLQGRATVDTTKFGNPLAMTRKALRELHGYTFQHTLRGGNTMADSLANLAMDHGSTNSDEPQSTTHTATCRRLRELCVADLAFAPTAPPLPTFLRTIDTTIAQIQATIRPSTTKRIPAPMTRDPSQRQKTT